MFNKVMIFTNISFYLYRTTYICNEFEFICHGLLIQLFPSPFSLGIISQLSLKEFRTVLYPVGMKHFEFFWPWLGGVFA